MDPSLFGKGRGMLLLFHGREKKKGLKHAGDRKQKDQRGQKKRPRCRLSDLLLNRSREEIRQLKGKKEREKAKSLVPKPLSHRLGDRACGEQSKARGEEKADSTSKWGEGGERLKPVKRKEEKDPKKMGVFAVSVGGRGQ